MGSPATIALARPLLRPGLHAVRRDDTHLQIGLDEPDRLVLPDRPGLLGALRALPRLPTDRALLTVLASLADDGWLVDGCAAAPARAALALTADPLLVELVTRSCLTGGVPVTDVPGPRLVACVGEPRRVLSDDLMRRDVTHLWLAVFPGSVRVGPFVEPGRTACLRCLDAHLGDRDPRRATVLLQLGELPSGSDTAHDASLAQIGAGWAVRDLARHLEGAAPSLRSATVTVTSTLEVTRREWLRHPHCGCAWG